MKSTEERELQTKSIRYDQVIMIDPDLLEKRYHLMKI